MTPDQKQAGGNWFHFVVDIMSHVKISYIYIICGVFGFSYTIEEDV